MEHVAKPLAVEVLHAAVRLGRAAEAVELLDRLGGAVDGPFAPSWPPTPVPWRRRRRRAGGGGRRVRGARGRPAGGRGPPVGGQRLPAGRGGASVASAARRCDDLLAGAATASPALEPVAAVGEELTEREREVALLAARGRTSPEIAEALFLSVRTVDTHLSRVYRKLMIEGRRS